MESYSYLHLGEPEDPDRNMVCKYRVTTDLLMERAAEAIATEQSTRVCTGIYTLDRTIFDHLGARIASIEGDLVTAKFPAEDFSIEVGLVPQVLSIIARNLFGLGPLKGVKLEDATLSKSVLEQFNGPKFGATGLRETPNRPDKPLMGTIVKPKIGLSPRRPHSASTRWAPRGSPTPRTTRPWWTRCSARSRTGW